MITASFLREIVRVDGATATSTVDQQSFRKSQKTV